MSQADPFANLERKRIALAAAALREDPNLRTDVDNYVQREAHRIESVALAERENPGSPDPNPFDHKPNGRKKSGELRAGTAAAIQPHVEQNAVEPQVQLVADMPDAVLDGWLGEVYQRRMSDFPISYAWVALVTAAGTLVPSGGKVRTNLYGCLVGPQGSGKSTTIDRACNVLGIEPPILLKNVKAGSAEGLIEHYLQASGAGRLFSPDELGHVLEKSKIENASYTYFLNTAFYHDTGEVTVARRKRLEFSARLSLLAGVIDDLFSDLFGRVTTGGLYGRFIFGQCPTGFEFAYRPFQGGPELQQQPFVVDIDHEVWDARDQFRRESGISVRELELALRVAVICAAFDQRSSLRAKDLAPAWAFARYQHAVRELLKPNTGRTLEGELCQKFLAYLGRYAANGHQVAIRQMYRDTRAYDYGLSIADRALTTLAINGDVETGKIGKLRVVNLPGEIEKL